VIRLDRDGYFANLPGVPSDSQAGKPAAPRVTLGARHEHTHYFPVGMFLANLLVDTGKVEQAMPLLRDACRAERYTARGGPDTWWPTPQPPHRVNQTYWNR
jgi:hypothetical protein